MQYEQIKMIIQVPVAQKTQPEKQEILGEKNIIYRKTGRNDQSTCMSLECCSLWNVTVFGHVFLNITQVSI